MPGVFRRLCCDGNGPRTFTERRHAPALVLNRTQLGVAGLARHAATPDEPVLERSVVNAGGRDLRV